MSQLPNLWVCMYENCYKQFRQTNGRCISETSFRLLVNRKLISTTKRRHLQLAKKIIYTSTSRLKKSKIINRQTGSLDDRQTGRQTQKTDTQTNKRTHATIKRNKHTERQTQPNILRVFNEMFHQTNCHQTNRQTSKLADNQFIRYPTLLSEEIDQMFYLVLEIKCKSATEYWKHL